MMNVVQFNRRATVLQIAGVLIKKQPRTSVNELFSAHYAVLSMVAEIYVNEALALEEKYIIIWLLYTDFTFEINIYSTEIKPYVNIILISTFVKRKAKCKSSL
ncbi:hypothetical protein TNCV_2497021 [Trichonephila clavipes]|nr:hypothetical protein TNCV_2497021 [Trichonephila clavipes]